MKLNESSAAGWSTAAGALLLAGLRYLDGPDDIARILAVFILIGALICAFRAGRDKQRSPLTDLLPSGDVSVTLNKGKVVDLTVKS